MFWVSRSCSRAEQQYEDRLSVCSCSDNIHIWSNTADSSFLTCIFSAQQCRLHQLMLQRPLTPPVRLEQHEMNSPASRKSPDAQEQLNARLRGQELHHHSVYYSDFMFVDLQTQLLLLWLCHVISLSAPPSACLFTCSKTFFINSLLNELFAAPVCSVFMDVQAINDWLWHWREPKNTVTLVRSNFILWFLCRFIEFLNPDTGDN